MRSLLLIFFALLVVVFQVAPVSSIQFAFAQSEQEEKAELERKISEYEQQIKSLQEKASTLANQISQFNAQIKLTELKIQQTEDQISLLSGRIGTLTGSVSNLTDAFNARVLETYKLSRLGGDPLVLATSTNLRDALTRYQYLTRLQEADQALLTRLKKANDGYQTQKTQLTELTKQLATAKAELDTQKSSKANLLSVTKNDEKRYQELLTAAKTEYDAIQAIIAGRGQETEVGKVAQGEKIATVIEGASCNSSGTHLHFIVTKSNMDENPFRYLKPGVDYENCSGPGACTATDTFDPSGTWNWPLDGKISFHQGYGQTWFVKTYKWYPRHDGIDISSDTSSIVKAVQPGILYRGSFNGARGCKLRYVRVKHDGSDLNTYYLHINY